MNDEDKAFFLSWCIEEYAAEKGIPSPEISELFSTQKVLDYLDENAEILHTQGKNYILDSIEKFLKK